MVDKTIQQPLFDLARQFIKKHSALIQMNPIMNATDRKCINGIIFHAKKMMSQGQSGDVFTVPTADFKKIANIATNNNDEIYEAFNRLYELSFDYNMFGKDRQSWGRSRFLSHFFVKRGERPGVPDAIEYSLPPKIHTAIENPSMFSILNMFISSTFSGKHTAALYELLIDYVNVNIPPFTVGELKAYLGVKEGMYPEFKYFKEKVINPSVTELNESSDLNVSFTLIKDGKRVTAVQFLVVFRTDNNSVEQNAAASRLANYGFVATSVNHILAKFTPEQICRNLDYFDRRSKKKNVDNKINYILSAIEGDFAGQDNEFKKKISSANHRLPVIEPKNHNADIICQFQNIWATLPESEKTTIISRFENDVIKTNEVYAKNRNGDVEFPLRRTIFAKYVVSLRQ